MPSSSRTRRRSDSVRGLMPGHARSSSLKRRGPSDRSWSMTAVHFAPMISAVHATEHCSSCTGRMVRIRTFYATGRTPSTALPVRGWLAARCEPTPKSWPRPSDSGCCACAGSVVSRNGTSRHRVCRTRTSRASRRATGHRRPMRSRKIASRLGVSAEYLATGRELPPAGDRELRLGDAELRLRLGDPGAAEEAIREVLADARAVGDAPVAHRALVALAIAADRRDRPREVVELFEEVVESERPPIVDAPEVYALLGRSYDALGEVARAASLFTRCLTELRGAESVDPILCVRFATHLSTALADAGDTAGAERALADALARADAVTERYTLIRLYWSLGRFHAERGLRRVHSTMCAARSLCSRRPRTRSNWPGRTSSRPRFSSTGPAHRRHGGISTGRRAWGCMRRASTSGLLNIEQAKLDLELGDEEPARQRAVDALGVLETVGSLVPGSAWRALADVLEAVGEHEPPSPSGRRAVRRRSSGRRASSRPPRRRRAPKERTRTGLGRGRRGRRGTPGRASRDTPRRVRARRARPSWRVLSRRRSAPARDATRRGRRAS